MNPDDMKSAFTGIPMEHNVFLYGVIPVLLLVLFLGGLVFGNQRNPGHFFAAVGIFGWVFYVWSLVSKYGDKAIGELWADQLIVFFVCVPVVVGLCFFAGLMKGLSGSQPRNRARYTVHRRDRK